MRARTAFSRCFGFVMLALIAPVSIAGGGGSPITPATTIVEIMADVVVPASDALWAVPSEFEPDGPAAHGSAGAEELWAAADRARRALAEAAEALLVQDRRVDAPGALAAFPEEELHPHQIRALIDEQPEVWVAMSRALGSAAQEAEQAIAARDTDALTEAGGALYDSCESCHRHFWYPGR